MNTWQKLLGYNHQEFDNQLLKVTKGEIPKNLKGTLYRNTSAILKRKNGLPGHLFDGDGAILKVVFNGDMTAIASYSFVHSQWFNEENQKDEYIFSGLGRLPTGNRLQKIWNNSNMKNAANTSVIPLKQGPLLALWEGGWPISMEKASLKTTGMFNGGVLKDGDSWSAHPKVCPKTGLVYNMGMINGATTYIMATEMDQSGKILKHNKVKVDGTRFMCHDFVLAGNYLVAIIYPQFIESIMDMLSAAKTFVQNIIYRPEAGTQIIIFDINKNLQEVSNIIDKTYGYAWHYANGMINQDGNIELTQAGYKNFDSFYGFDIEVLKKDGMLTEKFKTSLEKVIINPTIGKIVKLEQLYDDLIEFPIVEDANVGQPWDVTYACMGFTYNDFLNGIVRYTKNERTTKQYPEGQYVSEALHIQDDSKEKGQGWLILVIFDGKQEKSFVEILDCISLDTVCQLELPKVVALSFHGKFEKL